MNNISLVGRLTAAPELKQTQSGTSVVSFTLAVDRPGSREQTDFLPCVAWQKTAEFVCKYFGKGQRIGLVGKLTSRLYEDKQGNKRTAYEVVADRVEFVESKQVPGGAAANIDATFSEYEEIDDSDLPF